MPKNDRGSDSLHGTHSERQGTAGFLKNISFANNPVFIRMLAISPVLAVTVSLKNGVFFSLLMTVELLLLFAVKALCYDRIPKYLRDALMFLAAGIIITPIAFLAKRYFPNAAASLDFYLPLIAVNALAFVKTERPVAEPVLSRRVGKELLNILGSCLGFSIAVILVSAIREAVGSGTLYERALPGLSAVKFSFILLPPGAFILLGLLFAFAQARYNRKKKAAVSMNTAEATAISADKKSGGEEHGA